MCFSQFAQYSPRPVYHYEPPERPEGAPPTKADMDDNLFGPKPLPPQWQKPVSEARIEFADDAEAHEHNGHSHNGHGHPEQNAHYVHNGQPGNGTAPAVAPTSAPAAAVYAANGQSNGGNAIASVSTQTVEAVVVELSNGARLLICPL